MVLVYTIHPVACGDVVSMLTTPLCMFGRICCCFWKKEHFWDWKMACIRWRRL